MTLSKTKISNLYPDCWLFGYDIPVQLLFHNKIEINGKLFAVMFAILRLELVTTAAYQQ